MGHLGNKEFALMAKKEVVKYHNLMKDPLLMVSEDDVYVVWICKVLQNNKALLATNMPDGMYYEVTFNGDKRELYIDAYTKENNKCVNAVDIVREECDAKDLKSAAIVGALSTFSTPDDGEAKTSSLRSCTAQKETAGKVKNNSPYEKTVTGMLSADYKERFRAEYEQLKIRIDKLNTFCNRIEAANEVKCALNTHARIEEPRHDCSFDLLMRQLCAMREYMHILEVRAVIEGIEL